MNEQQTKEKVKEILSKYRDTAINTQQKLKEEIYQKAPVLYNIDSDIAGIAKEIAITAISGDTEKINTIKEQIKLLHDKKTEIIESLGYPKDVLDIKYRCPLCEDTGFYKGKRCKCYTELLRQYSGFALPQNIGDTVCDFANFKLNYYPISDDIGNECRKNMEKLLNYCINYSENIAYNPESLLFLGGTGLGKTHLSLAIANNAIQKDKISYARFLSAQELIDAFERVRFDKSPTFMDREITEDICTVPLLIIDDLGSEFITSFTQSVIYNVINQRILNNQATIITTNVDLQTLSAKYENRIASRILFGYKAFKFNGNDIRMQKRINRI